MFAVNTGVIWRDVFIKSVHFEPYFGNLVIHCCLFFEELTYKFVFALFVNTTLPSISGKNISRSPQLSF